MGKIIEENKPSIIKQFIIKSCFLSVTLKQIVSKVTKKYESSLDLAFLKIYPAKFYQVSDYRLSKSLALYIEHGDGGKRNKGILLRASCNQF